MLRPYINQNNFRLNSHTAQTTYFVGDEVENTIFKDQKTLFVACTREDVQEVLDICRDHNCTHVYLGANKLYSYDHTRMPSAEFVLTLMEARKNVTLDVPISRLKEANDYLGFVVLQHEKFNLMLSVEVPFINSYKNISIKIDDKDFQYSNPGVWVFSLKDLPPRTFNHWGAYGKDEIV